PGWTPNLLVLGQGLTPNLLVLGPGWTPNLLVLGQGLIPNLLVLGQGLTLNLLVLDQGLIPNLLVLGQDWILVHPRPSLSGSTEPAEKALDPPILGLDVGFPAALGATRGKIAASYSDSSSLCSDRLALSEIARLRMQPSITSWARRILCADAA